MKINIIVDDINLFEYDTPSITKFLSNLQKNLYRGRLINPNWTRLKRNVRKFLEGSSESTIAVIRKSKTQDDVWIVNLIVPVVQDVVSIYLKTASVPIFISKKEIGPKFLLDNLEEKIKILRKMFPGGSLNKPAIRR